jgi:LEA14-like dessication related protein
MLKFVISIFFLLFIGCTSVVKSIVKEPVLQFQEVKITNLNLEAVHLDALLVAENKNNFSLKFDEVQYELVLKNKSVFSGIWNEIPSLEPMKKTELRVPMKLPLNSIIESSLDLLTQPEIPYEIKGKVKYGILSIPFEKKGIVNK